MKKITFGLIAAGVLLISLVLLLSGQVSQGQSTYNLSGYESKPTWWKIQSIDTMKYSRDLAREKANDIFFDSTIENQITAIAQTGVTHVAIGTAYDSEFMPFMQRWINVSRKHGLKVWFRGNFAGWEGWFNYPKITPDEHIEKLHNFILDNEDIFEDGDIFSPCTECENGGPGDPRMVGRVNDYRKFLISQYRIANDSFKQIGKSVDVNFPMNGDVAHLVMDKETTEALGGVVVVDHYVATPEQLLSDIKQFAEKSDGKIILGELGAPILDIHGEMYQREQALWIEKALILVSESENLIGVNYWTSFGGSTQIWEENGSARLTAEVLKKFYNPKLLTGRVINELGRPVKNATVSIGPRKVEANNNGKFEILYVETNPQLTTYADGYINYTKEGIDSKNVEIILVKEKENLFFRLLKTLQSLELFQIRE